MGEELMQKRENLFLYNVLNQEIVFEEYFCNLLKIDTFRNLFLIFIKSKNGILTDYKIGYENFNTEIILDDECGRADLFLKIGKQKFIFEIKNKNWTNLTDNQPNGYLNYLNKLNYDNHNKHLFFLIPKLYKHKEEIYQRWDNFNEIDKQIFYWQDFVLEIKKSNLHNTSVEIDMFYQFCLSWFNMKIITFTKKEIALLNPKEKTMNNFTNKSIPILMKKLEYIIDDIGYNTNMKKCNDCIGLNYSIMINDYTVYFGIDYEMWENKGIPLNIVIQNHKIDYDKFELEIEDTELMEIEYSESSSTNKMFGFAVILDEEIGNEGYQQCVIDTLIKIINFLTKH